MLFKLLSPTTQMGREGLLSGPGQRAVSEVLLSQNSHTGEIVKVTCHRILSDGSQYETKPLGWDAMKDTEPLPVGRAAQGPLTPKESPHEGPWWTRAALMDRSYLLAAR